MRIGLVGDSYRSYSLSVDGETTMNFYPEVLERDGGKARAVLYRTPGLVEIAEGVGACRGIYTEPLTNRVFIVNGDQLNEFQFTGLGYAFVNIGTLNSSSSPVQFASNGFDLGIVSGNQLYMVKLATNAITLIPALSPVCITFFDSYFVVSEGGITFTNSAPFDGYTWPGDEYVAEQVPDGIVNLVSDTRYLWIQGIQSTEIWGADGSADGPLTPVSNAAMLIGTSSRDCTVAMDNTFFWLGRSANGDRIAYRANGFSAVRVSNHAIEAEWSRYEVVSDAVAFTYQEMGHTFWVISFPYEDKTWVYDASTSMWHERGFFNTSTGQMESIRGRYGCFGLGFQLVADKTDGRVYRMSMAYLDDAGEAIRRVRRTPHSWSDNKRLFFSRLELYAQPGVGLVAGQGDNPQVMLRYSDDGGYTWSGARTASLGPIGATRTRTIWRRLGKARDRVWEFSITDPVDVVFIDADVSAVEGYS